MFFLLFSSLPFTRAFIGNVVVARASVCIFFFISCNHHIRALNQHGMRFLFTGVCVFSAGLGSVKLYFVIFSFSPSLLHNKKEGFFPLYFSLFLIFLIVGYSYGACFPFYFILFHQGSLLLSHPIIP